MHEDLLKKLESIGDTPIKEPKLYEIIEKNEIKKSRIIEGILTREEIVSYSAQDIHEFIEAVIKKVKDYRYENGVLKTTPNTENCRMPNFLEMEDFRELVGRLQITFEALDHIQDFTKEQIEEFVKTGNQVNTEMEALAKQISGLDFTQLIDWEKQLVYAMIADASSNVFNTPQGKH
jgi:hypothetical protein